MRHILQYNNLATPPPLFTNKLTGRTPPPHLRLLTGGIKYKKAPVCNWGATPQEVGDFPLNDFFYLLPLPKGRG